MIFTPTKLPGAYIINLEKRSDDRGFFARTFCQNEFKNAGINVEFVQGNTSLSLKKGTLRGMHFQNSPFEEDKLVRCTKGALFDVIIDLRKNSPTFKQWFGVELSEKNHTMLFIPKGFAHGFVTLEDNTEANYLVSQIYTPSADSGVRYDDPAFGIDWPAKITIISDKDKAHLNFEE